MWIDMNLNAAAKTKKVIITSVKYFLLLLICFIAVLPFVYIFFTSFKTSQEYDTLGKLVPPGSFLNFANFSKALIDGNMLIAFKNTFIILAVSLTGSILFGAMVGYVSSRFDFIGKKFILGLFFTAMLIPMVTTQVATYQIVVNFLHLDNTIWSAIVLYLGADVVNIYIMIQFIQTIPSSIDESAMLDGASYPRIFFSFILPNIKPAIATVAIIKGVAIYNDFYIPYLYMPDTSLVTMSTSLFKFKGSFDAQWNVIAAGILLVIIPTLIGFLLLQKYIYNGFTAGAVKG
jgi:ABC-type glycerol-3-phosphate transport system permease component